MSSRIDEYQWYCLDYALAVHEITQLPVYMFTCCTHVVLKHPDGWLDEAGIRTLADIGWDWCVPNPELRKLSDSEIAILMRNSEQKGYVGYWEELRVQCRAKLMEVNKMATHKITLATFPTIGVSYKCGRVYTIPANRNTK
jgi:hypothetical protein